MLSRGGKITVGILAVPTVLCVLLAGLHLHNEIWRQWSERYGWANMWMGSVHSPVFFVFALIALLNFVLLLTIGVWWFWNRRNAEFPHRFFAAWLIVLIIGAASYFPSDEQYLAASVFVLGPRPK